MKPRTAGPVTNFLEMNPMNPEIVVASNASPDLKATVERLKQLVLASAADASRRGYASDFAHFTRWAQDRNLTPLPATTEVCCPLHCGGIDRTRAVYHPATAYIDRIRAPNGRLRGESGFDQQPFARYPDEGPATCQRRRPRTEGTTVDLRHPANRRAPERISWESAMRRSS